MLNVIMFSADKELVDGSNDKWSFDGTVRHLPQGVVPGENGPVSLAASVTPPEQQPQTSVPSPSSSSSSSLTSSSTEQLPPPQQQQQQNHIEQVRTVDGIYKLKPSCISIVVSISKYLLNTHSSYNRD